MTSTQITLQRYKDFSPTGFDAKGLNADTYDIGQWYVAPVTRNRDSSDLAESNFASALKMLGNESETVQVHRFGHWACGWFEIILINPWSVQAVTAAQDIAGKLADYPVLNEEDYSQRQWDTVTTYWANCSVKERVEYLQRVEQCIFAARRKDFPQDDNGHLFEILSKD